MSGIPRSTALRGNLNRSQPVSAKKKANKGGRATRILCRTCQWSEDEDGNWDSACGECHTFTTDGPKENKARWCCYCGGELVAVPFSHNVESIHPETKP